MSIVTYIGSTFIAGRFTPICLSILLLAAAIFAAQPATVSSYHDPTDLVRKAVQNEIKAVHDDTVHFLLRGVKTTPQRVRPPESMSKQRMLPPAW